MLIVSYPGGHDIELLMSECRLLLPDSHYLGEVVYLGTLTLICSFY